MIKRYDPQKDKTMTRDAVRQFDYWAINNAGISGAVLMENAGIRCTEVILERLKALRGGKVCVVCGTGNNGGDGFVIARQLAGAGFDVSVVICGDAIKISGESRTNYDLAKLLKLKINVITPANEFSCQEVVDIASRNDLIVDAIFGSGLTGHMRRGYENIIEAINSLGRDIIAVDIPSGLDCDTAEPLPVSIRARATVTLVAPKKGFASQASQQYTGDVYIASIGIEPSARN